MIDNEIILNGGNVSQVTTDGEIIYKDLKPQSKSMHRLLLHLEEKGINFCPKFLGIDENGREKLSFVRGLTWEDYPKCKELSDKITIVRTAAKLLKTYHDATVDFVCDSTDNWFLEYKGDLYKEVICHNDFAPYNITFVNNLPVGMIDFDTACPAPRVWDIAYAVYRFVPLSREVYDPESNTYRVYNKDCDAKERKVLLKEFVDTYGININIGEQVILRLEALIKLFDTECDKGNEAFIRMREEGHKEFYINEVEFIKENFHDWWD